MRRDCAPLGALVPPVSFATPRDPPGPERRPLSVRETLGYWAEAGVWVVDEGGALSLGGPGAKALTDRAAAERWLAEHGDDVRALGLDRSQGPA